MEPPYHPGLKEWKKMNHHLHLAPLLAAGTMTKGSGSMIVEPDHTAVPRTLAVGYSATGGPCITSEMGTPVRIHIRGMPPHPVFLEKAFILTPPTRQLAPGPRQQRRSKQQTANSNTPHAAHDTDGQPQPRNNVTHQRNNSNRATSTQEGNRDPVNEGAET